MPLPETITLPGAVDLHVHLREPSLNKAETIMSGTRAALLGGYVLLGDMPNNPGNETWSETRILEKQAIIEQSAKIPVATYAGSQPDHDNIGELASMAPHAIGLKLYGAPTTGNDKDFTADDFRPIINEWDRVAPDKPIMLHAGKSNLMEMIELVAVEKGHQLHICHVNDPSDVEKISVIRDRGYSVTSGVTPHHIFKDSHDVMTEGWFARMQPPLADQNAAEALFRQLVRGEIDVIETDHAPHSMLSKLKAEDENPLGVHDPEHTTCFGVPGIEYAIPLLLRQAKVGRITLGRIAEVTSTKPAQIFGVTLGEYTEVEWDTEEYRISEGGAERWTPFIGKLAVGTVKNVNIGGRQVISDFAPYESAEDLVTHRGDEM